MGKASLTLPRTRNWVPTFGNARFVTTVISPVPSFRVNVFHYSSDMRSETSPAIVMTLSS